MDQSFTLLRLWEEEASVVVNIAFAFNNNNIDRVIASVLYE